MVIKEEDRFLMVIFSGGLLPKAGQTKAIDNFAKANRNDQKLCTILDENWQNLTVVNNEKINAKNMRIANNSI